ncbi:MAG: LysM peptidoglycan-binding domain-containing protein [Clostridiales bacterium]|jgi:ribosomal protein L19E|nr:LysM peptidoglycan-binding domain-containing protein [Clostridiales bacterium]
MNKFTLPTNIRQIGNAEGLAMKIYVEDYVCSYLKQYAESGGHTEKIAFLVGKYMIIDAVPYVFIHGVIQGKHTEYVDNMESFTDASYDHAEDEIAKYFSGSEILGWMQSQPGYGVHLNPSYADYHMNHFTRPYQILFVMDPIEKLNVFYMWNPEMTGMGECGGYFVYYEQNRGMQEYMNNNRISRAKVRELAKTKDEVPSTRLKIFEEGPSRGRKKSEEKQEASLRASGRGSKTMSSIATTQREERGLEDVRKMSNLLIGLCAVLFITTFIMGAGLLQSDGRIGALENAIVTIDNNNIIIADQIRQLASLPAFAEQDHQAQAVGGNVADGAQHYQPVLPEVTPIPEITPPPTPPPVPEVTPTPIPEETPAADATPAFANIPDIYVIQPGDTLFAVSQMFYGDIGMVTRIMEYNNIEDPNHIVIGQTIYLPQY